MLLGLRAHVKVKENNGQGSTDNAGSRQRRKLQHCHVFVITTTRSMDDRSNHDADDVFSPLTLRGLTLPNRFIKAATHDGASLDEIANAYCRLARNGVSLLTVAYVSISPIHKTFDTQHHIARSNLAEWTACVRRVSDAGGQMSAQLHHPGLFCMASTGRPMGPSLFYLPSKAAWPHVMSQSDLAAVLAEYVEAARLCVAAGFVALEIHCGHGYLLSQFLSPLVNRRRDGYGGPRITDRARFPSEVIRAVRAAVPPAVPILVKMNGDDGFCGGLRLAEALIAARLFAAAGADAIVPSYGYTSLNGFGMLRGDVPLDQMASALPVRLARLIVRLLGQWLVPTISYTSTFLSEISRSFVGALDGTGARVVYVGGCDSLASARQVLADGCAAVQLGRPLLREPWFVRKLEAAARHAASLDAAKRRAATFHLASSDAASRHAAGRDGGESARERDEPESTSRCTRCNLCTLASIDPARFKAGCPLVEMGEGRAWGDIEELSSPGPLKRL